MPVEGRTSKDSPVNPDNGEEVVISGIAGRFASCENMNVLREKLMRKEDLICDECRWQKGHPEIPPRMGITPKVDKFDAAFFNIPPKQVELMDPMCRLLLEHAFESVVDAGVNPRTLRGKKVATIIGLCYSDAEKTNLYEVADPEGLAILGVTRSLVTNRISDFLDIRGPAFIVDTACSSSLSALDLAYQLIREGSCEAAIVGGVNLCFHPNVTLLFARLGVLSSDGRCKTFDEASDGYVRSEAVCTVFLQKAKDAKRIYSTVVHSKLNADGYKEQGITFPSKDGQQRLLETLYRESRVQPRDVPYVEFHGTGTAVGDPEELQAVAEIFCKDRTTPLMIGSVKSNLGHSEPSSGICGLAKVIIAMETGIIPPNLNLKNPRGIIQEFGMKPILEPTPWNPTYVGVNSFGFGGANAHVLMKAQSKRKPHNAVPTDDLPRVIGVSGRTVEAVDTLLQEVENYQLDTEFLGLLHSVYAINIPGYPCRGYTVLGGRTMNAALKEIQVCDGTQRPVWYCSCGMEPHWTGIGEALLRFPVFAKTARVCDAVLRERGVDVYEVIKAEVGGIGDDAVKVSVGTTMMQLGLIDLLTEAGVVPDNLIGYSAGELGCAYADGCLTAEQAILAAYYRGLAMKEAELSPGAMAVVGLGYKELKDSCPGDIDVACHNSSRTSTISGPVKSVEDFVKHLQRKKILAKPVACCNVAYHSRYMAKVKRKLLADLKNIIPSPKPRSEKWISTSVPRKDWTKPEGKLCSAEYLVNNLLNPVAFAEAAELIPANAIVIEITPESLLQKCLRESLKRTVRNVPLTTQGHPDNAEFLVQALGKLYNAGLELKLANIYPPVQFPVSRGTPMIAPLIRWDHSKNWQQISYNDAGMFNAERTISIYTDHDQFQYMSGHVIDRRSLIPATSYLFFVWESYCAVYGLHYETQSVIFERMRFERATTFQGAETVKLNICIHRGDGRFEITEGGTLIVSGFVRKLDDPGKEKLSREHLPEITDEEVLSKKDFYKELRLRGYNYQGLFRGVESCSISGSKGHLSWNNNWATYMDTMLQFGIVSYPFRELVVPTSIRKLVIDVDEHRRVTEAVTEGNNKIPVFSYKYLKAVVSGGVEIYGLQTTEIARGKQMATPVVEEYRFVGYRDQAETSLHEMTQMCVELCCEIHQIKAVKILELVEDREITAEQLVTPLLMRKTEDLPLTTAESVIAAPRDQFSATDLPGDVTLIDSANLPSDGSVHIAVGSELFSGNKVQSILGLMGAVGNSGFLFSQESIRTNEVQDTIHQLGLQIVFEKHSGNKTLLLLRTKQGTPAKTEIIHVDTERFGWIERVKQHMQESEKNSPSSTRVVLVSHDPESGIIGFANCARREPYGEKLRTVLIMDQTAPRFSLEDPLYAQQLELDLPVNVLREGSWGCYRHLLLPPVERKPCFHVVLRQKARGDLASLQWVEGPIQEDHPSEDLIRVAYASLNFKDIMLATGKLSLNTILRAPHQTDVQIGLEYSGIDGKGNRVMGMLNNESSMTNLDTMNNVFRFNVPDEWTLQEAATVPCVYLTCINALYMRGNMKKGDKVLIHAGSGGIGQAAIHLALAEGCEVFTTVGTAEKRKFIRETFPAVKDDHIGNSRDTSFEQMIFRMTKGRGVDIVLNSLSEEKLRASLRCLARNGRFLEIGKYDIGIDSDLGMCLFRKGISFHAIMLDAMSFYPDNSAVQLRELMEDMLRRRMIKPIVSKCFSMDEVEDAFRYMAGGKHIGKILIKTGDETENIVSPLLAYPRYYCRPNKSYLLVGGLGGFGLELAHWLYTRGARNIAFVSRRGISNGYQRIRIEALKAGGVNVAVLSGLDASNRNDCQKILESTAKLAPLDGIFNLAVNLRDSILLNQTEESFAESVKPKAGITRRLDELSRTLCPELRHFVVFSSISCGKGNAGQTNYGFGNSVMERVCERRRREGLPGLAIQWGAVGEVGLVAEKQEIDEELSIAGTLQQKLASCFEELDKFLVQDRPVVSSMVVSETSKFDSKASTPLDAVMNILGLKELKNINQERTLAELGLDSMMAVEIKQVLERDFDIVLTLEEIRNWNIQKIKETSSTGGTDDKPAVNVNATKSEMFADIHELLNLLSSESKDSSDFIEVSTLATDTTTQGFIIAGINSQIADFESFWTKLTFPTECLRFPRNSPYNTMDKIIEYLMGRVLESMKNRRKFVVIGYSLGGILGIEIVRRLEKLGFSGRLILLDAAPLYLKTFKAGVRALTDDNIAGILLFVLSALNVSINEQIYSELHKPVAMEQKIEVFCETYKKFNPDVDTKILKLMAVTVYNRINILDTYNPVKYSELLESPVVLVKASEPLVSIPDPDYGMSKMTRGNVQVYTLEGNHRTVVRNPKLSFLISENVK